MGILEKWSWEMLLWFKSGYSHFLLHYSTMYYFSSVCTCVLLGEHSSQTQLTMSCNQCRKINTSHWILVAVSRSSTLVPSLTFPQLCRVTVRQSCWRFIFYLFDEFRRIHSADGPSVLGSICDCGCRLKKLVSSLHVIQHSLQASTVGGCRGFGLVLPNFILLIHGSVRGRGLKWCVVHYKGGRGIEWSHRQVWRVRSNNQENALEYRTEKKRK